MTMDFLIVTLRENLDRVHGLVGEMSEEQVLWKPSPEAWSTMEVLEHLVYEEREDFRLRLAVTLRQEEDEQWTPIDPEAWISEKQYPERELLDTLSVFAVERQESVDWLDMLETTEWDAVYLAPWGPMRAGDLLSSWVAHDFLHMRQLTELQYAYTRHTADPFQVKYAGDW